MIEYLMIEQLEQAASLAEQAKGHVREAITFNAEGEGAAWEDYAHNAFEALEQVITQIELALLTRAN